jgi:hypothetical protein
VSEVLGCQMVRIFSNPKSPFGKILEDLAIEDVVYYIATWSIILPLGLLYCHLVYFVQIWYILWFFGVFFPALCQEKSGNHGEVLVRSGLKYLQTFEHPTNN